ncbi:flagellar biosynthesis protein FlhB [Paenibacillus darwinianus]|uniref:Flagellar biosynthetic protein FlhB n=1 Tax=Paenibacillus darwinianus TaxID=1380763 RepID=A0A9W5S2I3_9BACL|nr:flagellar biosynthesis protein FlhB [Paenibacillus darwinianus]EXX91343.1 flagellar biosynthesis protein FlhB [Paenibacillus darwinianus]EXX92306.1 flagellar biosynthesis protein FlhB [Paenibacillus darwinianus]EXX92843.1 flagellar biosynthesis protein FlhB [Paenibacillus darwinianus]
MQTFRFRLDLQLFNQEKTEPATPKKRQETRQEGQVAMSQELPAAFILLFIFLSFTMLGDYYAERFLRIFGDLFESWLTYDLTTGNLMPLFSSLLIQLLMIIAPVFIIAVVTALISSYYQVGILLTAKPIMPKLSKINPIAGAKQLVSLRSMVEVLKSILKLIIIGFMVYRSLWGQKDTLLALGHMEPLQIFQFTASITLSLGVKIAALLVVLAIFDYIYQKYEYEKSIKMSKQDIKDEHKKSEGDPLIKGKIREKQRRMAIQRMMQNVPKADVVITNPTHFAVALQYDGSQMDAPVVLAKGMDHLALRIRELAKDSNVMIMENKPLARALYDRAEIGEAIPADLFQAVAEVLAYVYRMKGRVKKA